MLSNIKKAHFCRCICLEHETWTHCKVNWDLYFLSFANERRAASGTGVLMEEHKEADEQRSPQQGRVAGTQAVRQHRGARREKEEKNRQSRRVTLNPSAICEDASFGLVGQPRGEDQKDAKDTVQEDHILNEVDGIDVEVRGEHVVSHLARVCAFGH